MLEFFTIVGVIIFIKYIIEFFWNPVVYVWGTIKDWFVPDKKKLAQKFGSWAVVTGSTDGIGKQYAMELAKRGISLVLISRNLEKLKNVANEIVVTGGTDGIGKQYAMELAKRGISLVLISRNLEKLQNVANEIETLYDVKTKIIVADFSKGTEIYTHIQDELQDVPVEILVNNVGVGTDHPMRFCKESLQKKWDLIHVNIMAMTTMSHMLLPLMVERGCGAIVNVASATGVTSFLPYAAVYAATKAYIRHFTLSIQKEYAHSGVYIQVLTPAFVSTNMTAFSDALTRGNLFVPDASTYAKHAIATLGKLVIRPATGPMGWR